MRNAGHGGKCKVGSIAEEEYEVEDILAQRKRYGAMQYMVKWRGWPLEDCTWEAEDVLSGCPLILKAWREREGGSTL